jgi:hypothetical protein
MPETSLATASSSLNRYANRDCNDKIIELYMHSVESYLGAFERLTLEQDFHKTQPRQQPLKQPLPQVRFPNPKGFRFVLPRRHRERMGPDMSS